MHMAQYIFEAIIRLKRGGMRCIVAKKPRTRLLSQRCQDIAHTSAYPMCTIVFNMAQFINLLQQAQYVVKAVSTLISQV